jgi:hypothetical protein
MEERVTYIFRVEEQAMQETRVKATGIQIHQSTRSRGIAPDSYTGHAQFESQPGHQLF